MAEKWNARYAVAKNEAGETAWILREHAHLLPKQGQALDLACGLGANALFLAERSLNVSAWDCSSVAIEHLQASARARSLQLEAAVRDVLQQPPAAASVDVIVVAHFLERSLFPALLAALRPSGLLFYQTFTSERVDGLDTPSNPDFLLAPHELLALCQPLRILVYREEGLVGDLQQGLRARAACVGMRS
ncbi:MAG TPA: methyltransferase domain-containing protein [bacterium]|nr:methyltransferase domain-containing protein [bacterium]